MARKIDIQNEALTKLFSQAPLFEKFALVTAEEVTEEVLVPTIIKGGFYETENTGKVGDFVITNPDGEKYAVPREIFLSRYEPTEDPMRWKPTGRVRAFRNPYGVDVEIESPWGSPQFGEANCWFAVTVEDWDTPIGNNRYIIEAVAFEHTYREVNS